MDLFVASNDIAFKELFPIVLSLLLWGSNLANRKVLLHCDNEAVVTIVNKQSTRAKPTMHLIRILVSFCLKHNIVVRAVHVPGLENGIADALSRFQLEKFRSLAPRADRDPTPIPEHLWQLLIEKCSV